MSRAVKSAPERTLQRVVTFVESLQFVDSLLGVFPVVVSAFIFDAPKSPAVDLVDRVGSGIPCRVISLFD